jgi:hypothetical protein
MWGTQWGRAGVAMGVPGRFSRRERVASPLKYEGDAL